MSAIIYTANSSFAQDTLYKINGTVRDEKTNLPLNNVSVQINGTLRWTATDINGNFNFLIKEKEALLFFSYIGYANKFINADYRSYNNIDIFLSQKTQTLKEIVINSSPLETVAKSKKEHVLDYSFFQDDILIITYKDKLSEAKLIQLTTFFDTLSILNIPDKPTGLYKDCLGNNHIVCEKNIYQIYSDSSGLRLLAPKDIQSFETILYPCIASDSTNLYLMKKYGAEPVDVGYRVFYSHNHSVIYSYINKFDRKRGTLLNLVDNNTLQKKKKEIQFQKNKKIADHPHGNPAQERLFFETIIVKEVYAPLYKIDNKIYIFDYINSNILCYSSNQQLLSKVGIQFHKEKNWKREMCIDEKSGKAFAIFESKGISELKEINLRTGQINKSYKIPYAFVINILANDNYIYFLYKENDYFDTKYLSRLRID